MGLGSFSLTKYACMHASAQVDADGRSWRSGAKVEKRQLRQWFLGITKYADVCW